MACILLLGGSMRTHSNSFIFSFSPVVDSENDYIIRFRTPEHFNSDLFGIVENFNLQYSKMMSKRDGSVAIPFTIEQDDNTKLDVEYLDANGDTKKISAWKITDIIDNDKRLLSAYSWLANFGKEGAK